MTNEQALAKATFKYCFGHDGRDPVALEIKGVFLIGYESDLTHGHRILGMSDQSYDHAFEIAERVGFK